MDISQKEAQIAFLESEIENLRIIMVKKVDVKNMDKKLVSAAMKARMELMEVENDKLRGELLKKIDVKNMDKKLVGAAMRARIEMMEITYKDALKHEDEI